jgi:hypothetical protein
MPATQRAHFSLTARDTDTEVEVDDRDAISILPPPRERDARAEIDALRAEIEQIVGGRDGETAGTTIGSALESVTRLQIATANVDSCGPPSARLAGAAMTALADARLRGHADAIERGMTYTADNQLRLLQTP